MKPFACQHLRDGAHLVERLCQVLGALLMCNILIGRVGDEEFLLTVQRRGHGFLCIDILLTPIHDTNEPELEGVCPSGQDVISVSSGVHEIEFGKDSNGPTALRVHRPSEL